MADATQLTTNGEPVADLDEETCTYCGESFPAPVELHHTEDECRSAHSATRSDARPTAMPEHGADLQGSKRIRAWWRRWFGRTPPRTLDELGDALRNRDYDLKPPR